MLFSSYFPPLWCRLRVCRQLDLTRVGVLLGGGRDKVSRELRVYILGRGYYDPWTPGRARIEVRHKRVEGQVHLLAYFLHRSVCHNPFQQWPCSAGQCRATIIYQPWWCNTSTWFFPKQLCPGRLSANTAISYWDFRKQREFDQEVIKPIKERIQTEGQYPCHPESKAWFQRCYRQWGKCWLVCACAKTHQIWDHNGVLFWMWWFWSRAVEIQRDF